MPETVESLLAEARRRLRSAPFRPSTREASLLLGRILGLSEAQVLARSRDTVPVRAAVRFRELLARRLEGEPMAYLLGEREFYGRLFRVDPRVLIPRPETEHLVELALRRRPSEATRILDIGTGSGCLAITLALEIPGALVVAVDRSLGALAVAAENARRHGVGDRVLLAAGDLATAVALEPFDLVVSNPPYIAPRQAAALSPEIVRFEPTAALFAEGEGTEILERLLGELGGLRPATNLMLEIGADQAALIRRLAAGSPFRLVAIERDLADRPRVAELSRR